MPHTRMLSIADLIVIGLKLYHTSCPHPSEYGIISVRYINLFSASFGGEAQR